ncbi:hypothetical protein [Dermatobacter hominis]|uniref:hypothetical protein n=1 Tax=Dermatobacter hominis TaxID=2884263 RepID=UPI001D12E583|nr:hypothetical protein [Dermatobacter hominis]UDY34929.1 hypothetical protein LH044_16520 [Dermatobacter hominis]
MAWAAIAAGWSLMGWAVAGVLREADRTHPGSWASWVIGAALVHDLVVLPLVLLFGLGLTGGLPPAWRGPIRAGVTVVAVVGLATWPTVARFGASADNPSILPSSAGRNLAVIGAAVLAVGLVAGWVRARRGRSGP